MVPGFSAIKNCTSVYINTQSLARLSVNIPTAVLHVARKVLDWQMRRIASGIIEAQEWIFWLIIAKIISIVNNLRYTGGISATSTMHNFRRYFEDLRLERLFLSCYFGIVDEKSVYI